MWIDGDMYIDGGYINNLPVDIMKVWCGMNVHWSEMGVFLRSETFQSNAHPSSIRHVFESRLYFRMTFAHLTERCFIFVHRSDDPQNSDRTQRGDLLCVIREAVFAIHENVTLLVRFGTVRTDTMPYSRFSCILYRKYTTRSSRLLSTSRLRMVSELLESTRFMIPGSLHL